MNFFGHAAVAYEVSGVDPEFTLGAMLPDFSAMLRARIASVPHAQVNEGVKFHHAVDEAFHDSEPFRLHSGQAFAELEELGVSRGPARALAHVGVELLFDRVLGHNARYRESYLESLGSALSWAGSPTASERVAWQSAEDGQRFEQLLQALMNHGVDIHVCTLSEIAARLVRILARRPRLALSPSEQPHVLTWLTQCEQRVGADTSAMMSIVTKVIR
jgi:hypothetical protein